MEYNSDNEAGYSICIVGQGSNTLYIKQNIEAPIVTEGHNVSGWPYLYAAAGLESQEKPG